MKKGSWLITSVVVLLVLMLLVAAALATRTWWFPIIDRALGEISKVGGGTEIKALAMNECVELKRAYVWKDYVRETQTVNIYGHPGEGYGSVCREVTSWGWRVVWRGFSSQEDVEAYALGEAERVVQARDAFPGRSSSDPFDDPVRQIQVFFGSTQVLSETLPTP